MLGSKCSRHLHAVRAHVLLPLMRTTIPGRTAMPHVQEASCFQHCSRVLMLPCATSDNTILETLLIKMLQ